jgi:hypothetical protein
MEMAKRMGKKGGWKVDKSGHTKDKKKKKKKK